MAQESEIKVPNKAQESETKVPNKLQNPEMLNSLESLVDETLKIYEFINEEENTVGEVCDTIGMMLTALKTSVAISPALVGPTNSVKRAVLGQDGQIMIAYLDGEVQYKKLAELRSSTLMDILNDIFPKLRDAAVAYKKVLEERLSVYRTASKKMKKMEQVLKEEQKASMEDIMEESLQSNQSRLK